jgi:hypothetical protein
MAAPAPASPTAYAVRDEIDGSLFHQGFTGKAEARAFADPRNARRRPGQPPYRVYALVPVDNGTVPPGELARMFDVAEDHELAMLDEVAERAGLIWICRDPGPGGDHPGEGCGYSNDEDAERCQGCGAPRPAAA